MSQRTSRSAAAAGRLALAEYLEYYAHKHESRRRSMSLLVPRLLGSPSMHAVLTIRLAGASPRWSLRVRRTLLIAKHSSEFNANIEIGPGLMLPHPMCITLGDRRTWATA